MSSIGSRTVFIVAFGFCVCLASMGSAETLGSWWQSSETPTFIVPKPAVPSVTDPVLRRKARLLEGANRLIKKLNLPLEAHGYSGDLRADEEYRLYAGSTEGRAAIVFGDAFWNRFFERTDTSFEFHEYASYLLFVLLRAGADFDYRRHFDPDRCAWNVQADAEVLAPSLRVLRDTVMAPVESWLAPDGPVYKTDETFRRSLDPERNPARTLQALVRYGLGVLAQRAADRYALAEYERVTAESPTSAMRRRVQQHERALAWEFGRARNAMTMAERIAFRKALHNSFEVRVPSIARAQQRPTDASPDEGLPDLQP